MNKSIKKRVEVLEKRYKKIQDEKERYTNQKFCESTKLIHCKDCIHRPKQDSSFRIIPPIRNGKFDETCPCVCPSRIYTRMPCDDSFCSLGERDEKERT